MIVFLLLVSAPHINSIAPRAVRRLPPAVRETLAARACRIPESGTLDDRRQNIAHGHFTAPTSDDWAVLCLARGMTSIVVFRGTSGQVFADLGASPARDFLTGERQRDGTLVFERFITTASPDVIRRYFEYAGEKPPPLSHDGIDDANEKSSTVWYYVDGRWGTWLGSD